MKFQTLILTEDINTNFKDSIAKRILIGNLRLGNDVRLLNKLIIYKR